MTMFVIAFGLALGGGGIFTGGQYFCNWCWSVGVHTLSAACPPVEGSLSFRAEPVVCVGLSDPFWKTTLVYTGWTGGMGCRLRVVPLQVVCVRVSVSRTAIQCTSSGFWTFGLL